MSLTDTNFQDVVASGRVVVLFGIKTSGIAKRMEQYVDKLKITSYLADANECREVCSLYGIKQMPTTAIFEEGKLVSCRIGYMTEKEFLQFCE